MNCPKCGNGIPDNHTFCSKCGAKYEEQKKEEKKVSEEQHVSLLFAVLLIICIVLFFLTSGIPIPL